MEKIVGVLPTEEGIVYKSSMEPVRQQQEVQKIVDKSLEPLKALQQK